MGLKDHQIAALVNKIRDELQELTPVQSLRERIARPVMRYLEAEGLRIDNPKLGKEKGPTFNADIYVAGDLATIRNVCREYVSFGACVSITPIDYIFTGGAESGARITIINYQRFPSTPERITEQALELARILVAKGFQLSASVVTTDQTYYISDERKSHGRF